MIWRPSIPIWHKNGILIKMFRLHHKMLPPIPVKRYGGSAKKDMNGRLQLAIETEGADAHIVQEGELVWIS